MQLGASNAILTGVLCVSLLLMVLSHFAAHRKLSRDGRERRRRRDRPPSGSLPPISVLKPLCGVDEGLYENLVSIAAQDYPCFEILLGTEDPRDPALDVAQRLRTAFPDVSIRIVSGAPALGRNPKVNNLAWLAQHARHDLVLISDSNVRARQGYLRAMAAELQDPRVGMVANLISGTGERSLGAILENLHLSSFVSAGIAGAEWAAGRACVVGKSMLFRRSDLERLGGWRSLRNILAEDYVLGRRFELSGYRVVISPHVVEVWNGHWTLRRFLARHLRWAQMRRRLTVGTFLAEPVLTPTPWAIALLVAACLGEALPRDVRMSLALGAAAALAGKCSADAWLARRLRGRSFRCADLAWIPVKDLLVLGIWPIAAFRRAVHWRGHALAIGPASRLLRHVPRVAWRRRARQGQVKEAA